MNRLHDLNFLSKIEVNEKIKAFIYVVTIVAKFVAFIVMSVLAFFCENDGYWFGAGIFLIFSIYLISHGFINKVKFRSAFTANVDHVKKEKIQTFISQIPIYDFLMIKDKITKIITDRGYLIKDDFKKIKQNLELEMTHHNNTLEGEVIRKLIGSVDQVLAE